MYSDHFNKIHSRTNFKDLKEKVLGNFKRYFYPLVKMALLERRVTHVHQG